MRATFIKEKIKKDGLKIFFLKLARLLLTNFFYFRNYFFIKIKTGFPVSIIKEINGCKMFLDLKNDQGISRDLYCCGAREVLSVKYLLNSNILKEGDCALDIGANIGYYALLESRLVGERGQVYALEPVQKNFKILNKNIFLNNIKNIKTFKLAAGNKNIKDYINISRKGNWSSLVYRKGVGFFKKEEIGVVKIDDFLKGKKNPNLVRMDVEGYEYAIIDGMKKTLELGGIKILLEIHSDIMTKQQLLCMFNILENKGFRSAIIIFDPYLGWLNSKNEIRKTIRWLTEKIGDMQRMGKVERMNMKTIKEYLIKEGKPAHVLFYKKQYSNSYEI